MTSFAAPPIPLSTSGATTTGVGLINDGPKVARHERRRKSSKPSSYQAVKIHYQQNDTELSTLILNTEDALKPGSDEPIDTSELKLGAVEKKVADALVKAGTPLGLTRLVVMTGSLKRSVLRAIETLTEKGLVIRNWMKVAPKNTKLWRLAYE